MCLFAGVMDARAMHIPLVPEEQVAEQPLLSSSSPKKQDCVHALGELYAKSAISEEAYFYLSDPESN